MQKQQVNCLLPYSNSTLITFILTQKMEWHLSVKMLQRLKHCLCKTKDIFGWGFISKKSAHRACVHVLQQWQWLASAWHSADSASCPARSSSSPCWLDILPGSEQPVRTRATVINLLLKADRHFAIVRERERRSSGRTCAMVKYYITDVKYTGTRCVYTSRVAVKEQLLHKATSLRNNTQDMQQKWVLLLLWEEVSI